MHDGWFTAIQLSRVLYLIHALQLFCEKGVDDIISILRVKEM